MILRVKITLVYGLKIQNKSPQNPFEGMNHKLGDILITLPGFVTNFECFVFTNLDVILGQTCFWSTRPGPEPNGPDFKHCLLL